MNLYDMYDSHFRNDEYRNMYFVLQRRRGPSASTSGLANFGALIVSTVDALFDNNTVYRDA